MGLLGRTSLVSPGMDSMRSQPARERTQRTVNGTRNGARKRTRSGDKSKVRGEGGSLVRRFGNEFATIPRLLAWETLNNHSDYHGSSSGGSLSRNVCSIERANFGRRERVACGGA